jgi:phosphatidylserine decarboxylase
VRLIQAKGHHYFLHELLEDPELAVRYRDGCFATLRITADRYHRFHAPLDGHVDRIDYIAGDAYNVNPPAVARIAKLYCRNERAVVRFHAESERLPVLLVPVAAILVASIRFTFTDVRLHLKYAGPNRIDCDARLDKGAEMGWFEHGSTIIVIAPRGYALAEGIATGKNLRVGEALMCRHGFVTQTTTHRHVN